MTRKNIEELEKQKLKKNESVLHLDDKPKRTNFTAYFTPRVLEALKADAAENKRSASAQLSVILEEHLKKIGKL